MSTDTPDESEVANAYDDLDEEEQIALVQLAKKLGHSDPLQRAKDAATSRRGLLGTLTGAAAAGSVAYSAGKAEAADTSVGQIGAAGSEVDLVVDQIKDPGGDVLADVDDTGDVDWQGRGFDNVGSVETDDSVDLDGNDLSAGAIDATSLTAGSVDTDYIGNPDAVINNNENDYKVRLINAGDGNRTDSGQTTDLFKFADSGNSVVISGVADVMIGHTNSSGPVYNNLTYNHDGVYDTTISLHSNVELVPTDGGNTLTFRVTAPKDFSHIAVFSRVMVANTTVDVLV